jgi:hypothetical protein
LTSRTYDVGDKAKLDYELRDAAGALIDATVNFTSTKPDGTAGPGGVATDEPGTGEYSFTFTIDQAGLWLYKFTSSAAAVEVTDGIMFVRPDATANVYTTMAEMKGSMGLDQTDTLDDEDILDGILSASRWIDGYTERHFFRMTDTRTVVPNDRYCLELGSFMDLLSVISLKTDENADGNFETTWAASDYQLLTEDGTPNINAAPEPKPYTEIKAIGRLFPLVYNLPQRRTNLVQIEGVWGWPMIPDAVRRAARLLAVEHFKLKDAPFGASGIADLGIVRIRQNPKARELLQPYRKTSVFTGSMLL